MTILNESGAPDALSPLRGIESLAKSLPDALVVLLGTRSDAHLAQSVSGSFRNSRIRFLVLDPEAPPEPGRLAPRLVGDAAGFRGVGAMVLITTRSADLLGIDANFEARLAGRRLGMPVRAVRLYEPEAGGYAPLSTDLEDKVLASLVGLCPPGTAEVEASPRAKDRRLLGGIRGRRRPANGSTGLAPLPVTLLGGPESRPDFVDLTAELEHAGVAVNGGVPGSLAGELPAIGERSLVAPVDPYLSAASRKAEERGATVVRTLFPIGVDGTARFIQDVAAAAGVDARTRSLARARMVWEKLEPLRNRIRGKRIFFTGDTGLEIPLARFLSDAGAVVLEVGTPRLDRALVSTELQVLGGVDVVESPDWTAQLRRVEEAHPDVVIASPGLYTPLVARGHLCRSSLDFLKPVPGGIHGFEGARRILQMFLDTLERAALLDTVRF